MKPIALFIQKIQMLGKNGLYFASRKKVARKVTVAVERVFTLYVMQDAVREMTIYMNTSIHTSFFIQLHASYMRQALF